MYDSAIDNVSNLNLAVLDDVYICPIRGDDGSKLSSAHKSSCLQGINTSIIIYRIKNGTNTSIDI